MALSEQSARPTSMVSTQTSLIPRTTTLITAPDCPTAVTEAYLTLHTNLDFALLGTPGTVLMGAPLETDVQAAHVLANVAIAAAASGDEVLLVDCNIHEPSLHAAFGLPNERGLRDLLGRQVDDHDVVRPSGALPNLRVITAGTGSPGTLTTAATNELAETIIRLKELADRLILLGPPVLSYTDSLALTPYVDGIFVIVPAHRTRRTALQRARALLARVNAPMVGAVVLDRSPRA